MENCDHRCAVAKIGASQAIACISQTTVRVRGELDSIDHQGYNHQSSWPPAVNSPDSMKIAIATAGFLKMVPGQIGGLRSRGHEVLLVCRNHTNDFGGDSVERDRLIKSIGVEVVELPGRRFGPETLPYAISARRQVKAFDPDVVLAHENADPRLLMAVQGFPIVYTIHDPYPHPGTPRDPLHLRMASAAWKRSADRFVVHSDRLIEDLPRKIRRRNVTEVVPHGAEVRGHPFPVPTNPNVLMFGRLVEYKGVDVLVEAMNHVWEANPEAVLTVAGRGPEAARVPEDPRIKLLDHYIPEAGVDELFANATVCVLPYTQASQSGVGLLSLSMGVPTVVTDVGALPDLAENESRLVPPSAPKLLAQAISTALQVGDSERQATLEFARERFEWKNIALRYEEIFESLLS